MGCFYSTTTSIEEKDRPDDQPKKYSWDKRERVDPKDYTIQDLKGQTIGRLPGTVNGQQFIIQNCEDCSIYIFDHSATVSIDDCTNCRIFIGPVKTSVFIRDCTECRLAIACQQFRTRDCKKLDVFLSCVTQPIIEASTAVRFGCLQYAYPQLEAQFHEAGISVYNNNWSNTHDFTPVPGEENFSFLPRDASIDSYIPLPNSPEFVDMAVSTDTQSSIVPMSLGKRRRDMSESCLVVFFHDEDSLTKTRLFVRKMFETQRTCELVQSKEVAMQTHDAIRVFGSEQYAQVVENGPVIGFEYSGVDCCQACRSVLELTAGGATVFVSASSDEASQQVENFYNFADMQMVI